MIEYIIPLLASYFDGNMFSFWFVPVFILGFLATVPYIIRSIFRVR